MTMQTKFNMIAPQFERDLNKHGFAVSDEKTINGYEITKGGTLCGWLRALEDGTPFIVSAIKYDLKKDTILINSASGEKKTIEYKMERRYYTVGNFVRFGV